MPTAAELYPLSYPVIARLTKDLKHHQNQHHHSHDTLTSSPPPLSSSPVTSSTSLSPPPPSLETFSDHSLCVLGSNVEEVKTDIQSLKRDVSEMRADIQDIKSDVSILKRGVLDINWRLSDTQNRDWNGMVTRNYDLLKPVPHFDSGSGRLVDPPRSIWPKSLGHLIKIKRSERGLQRLTKLLQFYQFTGHKLWYSMSDSADELDSDLDSESDGEGNNNTNNTLRTPDMNRKPSHPTLSLEEAVKSHPEKAMHAFCLIIGVRSEVVESNQFYHDFNALRNIILKRPAASEGSPAAAKKVRMGGEDLTSPHAKRRPHSSSPPKTPPVRVNKRSPEFRQLIYEALQPKASPVSTVKTAETHVSWGTPEAERLRRRRELFGLVAAPTVPAPPAATAQPAVTVTAPTEAQQEDDTGSLTSHASSPEGERPRDTVDHLFEAIGIDRSVGPVISASREALLNQQVFSIDFASPIQSMVGQEEGESGDIHKSFASGTTEENPDLEYRSHEQSP